MNFSTDRDLLVLEPNVFRDVPFVSQQRLRVSDGAISGTTLTSASADFAAAEVDAGSVVLVDNRPLEVVSRNDANTLTVSLARGSMAGAALPPGDGTDLDVAMRTFAPQAALVHDTLLRLVGIDPDDPDAAIDEDAIVSLGLMARLEALGTLERVYSAAVAIAGDNESLLQKADQSRRAFHIALERANVLLDTDGDGHADTQRRPGLIRLVRV